MGPDFRISRFFPGSFLCLISVFVLISGVIRCYCVMRRIMREDGEMRNLITVLDSKKRLPDLTGIESSSAMISCKSLALTMCVICDDHITWNHVTFESHGIAWPFLVKKSKSQINLGSLYRQLQKIWHNALMQLWPMDPIPIKLIHIPNFPSIVHFESTGERRFPCSMKWQLRLQ